MNRKFATLAYLLGAYLSLSACGSSQPPAKPEAASPQAAASPTTFADQKAKVSYSIGMNIGGNFKRNSIEVDYPMLLKGIQDAMSGSKALLTDQQIQETLAAFEQERNQKQQQDQKVQGEKNKLEGEAFLASNKAKSGVVALPSGLQYEVIKEGVGNPPKESDTVVVHYKGTLINGKEFDSSYSRGEPASFSLGGIIPGMREALLKMKPGAKWRLVIPPTLAYGERQAGPDIGPNATLIFELEFLSLKAAAPASIPTPQPKLKAN